MIQIKNDMTVWFDVDDTLVKWNYSQEEVEKYGLKFDHYGSNEILVPHKEHIKKLKEHKLRNHTVIVWSAGGNEWAASVVKTLGLEDYVDLVICKPQWFYDDLPSVYFMPECNRIYKRDPFVRTEPEENNAHLTVEDTETIKP